MNFYDVKYDAHHFVSKKCVRPIACHRSGILHDLLIQLTLDPEIQSIDFLDSVQVGCESLRIGCITIETAKHPFMLDFEPTRIMRTTDEHRLLQRAVADLGLYAVEVTAAQVTVEPRFSTARAVWSHRRNVVPVSMKLAFAGVLNEDGPLSLHELCSRAPGPIDPVGAICALAYDATLDIDLKQGLQPETIVRCRT